MDDLGLFPINFDAALLVFNADFYAANLELAGLTLIDQDGDGDIDNDDAFLDYATEGFAAGRIASPVQGRTFVGVEERSVFDENFYLSTIPTAEAARIASGEFASALEHYILVGAALDTPNGSGGAQFDPNPFFDTAAYLAANPDVTAAGINPYFHLLQFGEDEAAGVLSEVGDALVQPARSVGVVGVDLDLYAAANPDVAALVESGASSLFQHVLQFGVFEGRPGLLDQSGGEGDDFGNTPPTAGAITVGETQIGSLEEAGDDDWFAVTLEAGVTYDITLRGTFQGPNGSELTDPFLRVFGPDGSSLLAFNDDDPSSLDSALTFTAQEDGVHFLSARAFADIGTGDYQIAVTEAAPVTGEGPNDAGATPATAGGPLMVETLDTSAEAPIFTGRVETPGDLDWYAVTLEAGASYLFDVGAAVTAPGPLADPFARLFFLTEAGETLLVAEGGGGGFDANAVLLFTAEESGTYFLEASSETPGGIGAYDLLVTELATEAPNGVIVVGGEGDDDLVANANAGQTTTIIAGRGDDRVTASPAFDVISLGEGADIFVAPLVAAITVNTPDIVLDFSAAEDRVDLSAFNFGPGALAVFEPNDPLPPDANFFGDAGGPVVAALQIVEDGANVVTLFVDGDGDGVLSLDDGAFFLIFTDPGPPILDETNFIL